jgi:tetratricopeptide (TPR) repeat protein
MKAAICSKASNMLACLYGLEKMSPDSCDWWAILHDGWRNLDQDVKGGGTIAVYGLLHIIKAQPNSQMAQVWRLSGRPKEHGSKYTEAIQDYEHALELFNALSEVTSDWVELIHDFADCLLLAGKPDLAARQASRALTADEELFGSGHQVTLRSLTQCAHIAVECEQHSEARRLYEQAYAGFTELWGAQDSEAMACKNALEQLPK